MKGKGATPHGRLGQLAYSSALCAVLLSTVCVFTPLTLYSGNQAEFTVPFTTVVQVYLPYLLILLLLGGLLGAVLPRAGFQRYCGVLAALAVLSWAQGNLLVWDYGPLDGRRIVWMEDAWRGVLDLALWISVLLVAYGSVRARRFLGKAAGVVFLMQLFTLAATGSPAGDGPARQEMETNLEGRDAIVRFSPDHNVVHVVMDGFQSDLFWEIVSDPDNRELKEKLNGFTFFRDNISVFPYTQMTIPALLSSKVYQNHIPADEFVSRTLQGETILSTATRAGYEVDIAAAVGLRNVYSLAEHVHSYGIVTGSHATKADYAFVDAARLIDLALFRVVPHFAKPLIHRDELWIFQSRGPTADYLHMQYFSDLEFLKQLRDEMTADRKQPVYKMLHLMLSHRPTVGNRECEFNGVKRTVRPAVLTQAKCGLVHVLDVLERMRELGIYDNSLVVLMADHGAWVPAAGVYGRDPELEGDAPEVDATTIGMAVPVLAVKPRGETGELRVSQAPTSVIDVPATIAAQLGLEPTFDGVPVFSHVADAARQRRHIVYAYGKNPDYEGYYFTMREYAIEGSPFDASAWRSTRLLRPEGNVEPL